MDACVPNFLYSSKPVTCTTKLSPTTDSVNIISWPVRRDSGKMNIPYADNLDLIREATLDERETPMLPGFSEKWADQSSVRTAGSNSRNFSNLTEFSKRLMNHKHKHIQHSNNGNCSLRY